jgi:beta-galactosidase
MPHLTIPSLPVAPAETYALGTAHDPSGRVIGVDAVSLRLDDARWMPVMGEFHYTRFPAAGWREELLKMKAGGIDAVATYVFWIHHEEVEGVRDWTGDRDLRRFVATAAAVGLRVVVRLGPWCHGEVRHGGLPDWVVKTFGDAARTDAPAYLDAVRRQFFAIAAQLDGLLWKQGGPVIAFQIENEYSGPAEHLLTLKRLAREVGLDAPLYTRTGWPDLATPLPFGELLPLYGAYPEGFWDRDLAPMPGFYPAGFRFSPLRTDAAIATDLLGERAAADAPDTTRYPFLTCELGGGMMSSYHRRIRIDPRDIESVVLTKLGSGGNLPGYYMYHGGLNPDGLTSLQESQATRYWNDLPEKNYDFQAPLGAAGQLRPHYHRLRRLHLFIRDFGAQLAGLPAHFPAERPTSRDDTSTLRWAVRADGDGGFVFINNYERLRSLPAKPGVRFVLDLPGGRIEFPSSPVTIPADSACIWPFGLELAPGVRLDHATAQLLCSIDEGNTRTIFFAATPGVPAEFAFNGAAPAVLAPGRDVALCVQGSGETTLHVVLLDATDSLALWKETWRRREHVFLTRSGLVVDGDTLRLSAEVAADLTIAVFPPLDSTAPRDGVFQPLPFPAPPARPEPPRLELVPLRAAGPARDIPLGWTTPPVAVAPVDADFAAAAVWHIVLPAGLDVSAAPLLRLRYTGDVARVRVGARLVLDDFFNGDALELNLVRHAAALAAGDELTVEILPLRADAPILLPAGTRPEAPTATLDSATLTPRHLRAF